MESSQTLPILDRTELRILGVLMEKSKTTPEYYPMTVNAITIACNQKTSRKPVVQYDEQTVVLTLDRLKKKGLISTATGGSSRSIKYKHNFAIVFPVTPQEVAILCLLILRGPQTPGELNTNSGRLYEFESLDEVQSVLERLADPEMPYVMQLPRRAGQKETRYTHLLAGVPDLTSEEFQEELSPGKPSSELESRLTKVEQELAELKAAFDQLMKELT
ncbi:YceH family protein [Pedobacter sp. MC2016-24]|uniref:YceH family protein n=1 Tax=Pedobacter sp. MC2016-24 TaxID=2780090 RepID=UPI00187FD792|nr:YceH family protein [Pedobacter sp. MC2016-24]MBE9602550.1 YceH family protein [Pedobacter sp. MC2016-24]